MYHVYTHALLITIVLMFIAQTKTGNATSGDEIRRDG